MVWYVVVTFRFLLSVEGLANKTAFNTPTQHQNGLNFRRWVMACVEDFKKGSNRSGSPYSPFPTPSPPNCKCLNDWPASSTKLTFRAEQFCTAVYSWTTNYGTSVHVVTFQFSKVHPSALNSAQNVSDVVATYNSKVELPSESVCGGGVTDLVSCYISRNMQSQFPVLRDIKNYFRITIDLCRNCARAVLYSRLPVFVSTKYRPVRRPTQPVQWKREDFFLGGKMATTWRSSLSCI
jgi:hypothetical protein